MANIGDYLPNPEAGWKRFDNTYKDFIYSSNWLIPNHEAYGPYLTYGTGAAYSNAGNVSFKFFGDKIRFIGMKWNTQPVKSIITIDGEQSFILTPGNESKGCILMFSKINLEKKIHTVTITHNDLAQVYTRFDAIDIGYDGHICSSNCTLPHSNLYLLKDSENKLYSVTNEEKLQINYNMLSGLSMPSYPLDNVIDGNNNTSWFLPYVGGDKVSTARQRSISFNLGKVYSISKFKLSVGYGCMSFDISTSNDGTNYTVIKSYTISINSVDYEFLFDSNVSTQYISIQNIQSTYSGTPSLGLNEVSFYTKAGFGQIEGELSSSLFINKGFSDLSKLIDIKNKLKGMKLLTYSTSALPDNILFTKSPSNIVNDNQFNLLYLSKTQTTESKLLKCTPKDPIDFFDGNYELKIKSTTPIRLRYELKEPINLLNSNGRYKFKLSHNDGIRVKIVPTNIINKLKGKFKIYKSNDKLMPTARFMTAYALEQITDVVIDSINYYIDNYDTYNNTQVVGDKIMYVNNFMIENLCLENNKVGAYIPLENFDDYSGIKSEYIAQTNKYNISVEVENSLAYIKDKNSFVCSEENKISRININGNCLATFSLDDGATWNLISEGTIVNSNASSISEIVSMCNEPNIINNFDFSILNSDKIMMLYLIYPSKYIKSCTITSIIK